MNARTLAILFGALALFGFADAAYLTWDHYAHLVDPNFGGGLCGIGSGCDISRGSAGELPLGGLGPGLPIAILAMAFYAAFGVLTGWRLGRPQDPHPRRIQFGLALLASVYSVALAVYSLVAQGTLCQLCAVLYVVNLALLAVAWRGLGEPVGGWLKAVWGSIPRASTALAAAVFFVAVGALYAAYAVKVSSAAPAPLGANVVALETTDRPTKGAAGAPVHVIEYADLQCPHCGHLFDAVEEAHAARPDKVRVTFLHFPLDNACNPAVPQEFHPDACWLAYVADCAGRQGKFFETTRLIFDSPRGATRDEVLGQVAALGLDRVALERCVAAPETHARVLADIQQGIDLGITGTPVFFVNGHKQSGARSRAALDALIDQALSASGR